MSGDGGHGRLRRTDRLARNGAILGEVVRARSHWLGVSRAAGPDSRDHGQQREHTGNREHAVASLARNPSPGRPRGAEVGPRHRYQRQPATVAPSRPRVSQPAGRRDRARGRVRRRRARAAERPGAAPANRQVAAALRLDGSIPSPLRGLDLALASGFAGSRAACATNPLDPRRPLETPLRCTPVQRTCSAPGSFRALEVGRGRLLLIAQSRCAIHMLRLLGADGCCSFAKACHEFG